MLIGSSLNRMNECETSTHWSKLKQNGPMEHYYICNGTFYFCVKSYWWKWNISFLCQILLVEALLKENLQINILNERQYRVIIIWNTKLKP